MKKHLLLLGIVFGIGCSYGQYSRLFKDSTGNLQIVGRTIRYDTIHVIMLCSDTSKQCGYAYGFEVGYSDHSPENMGVDLISTTYLIWHHITYLDAYKKPVKYFVWLSKQLPK